MSRFVRGFCTLALLLPAAKTATAADAEPWENYVSKHCVFTLLKPAGWKVEELYRAEPTLWAVAVMPPDEHCRVSMVHGIAPEGNDAAVAVRTVVADLKRRFPTLQVAPTARTRIEGRKTTYLFEGAYTGQDNREWQFTDLVSAGDGVFLNQRIEARDGKLKEVAPQLLQTLANLRVSKSVYGSDEGGRAVQPAPEPATAALEPRALAGGWGGYGAPAGWQQVDLGKGQVIACDPSQQVIFMVASAEFVTPRYNLVQVPGVLVSKFLRPHQAMAFACTQQGHGQNFRFDVRDRKDLEQTLRAGITGGRPCAVEDFFYTFDKKGVPYKGATLGYSIGNYMDSTWGFGHMSVWAPATQFDALVPLLLRIAASYELNNEKVGAYIAEGIRRYQAGIAALSRTIAQNSEQMRRENYELFMERGRVQEYVSYQTTRMIMGEWDYLAGSHGYVRGDASGLYTADGNRITSEPYGESVTRGMQVIDSRPLFEAMPQ